MKISVFYLKSGATILPYALIAIAIVGAMQKIDTGGWASFDALRFHEKVRIIINGYTPYISYVDLKSHL